MLRNYWGPNLKQTWMWEKMFAVFWEVNVTHCDILSAFSTLFIRYGAACCNSPKLCISLIITSPLLLLVVTHPHIEHRVAFLLYIPFHKCMQLTEPWNPKGKAQNYWNGWSYRISLSLLSRAVRCFGKLLGQNRKWHFRCSIQKQV